MLKTLVNWVHNGLRRIKEFARAAKATDKRLFGKSDIRRWSNQDNLSPDWDSRTIRLAAMINPNSKVLEFGAGRMILCQYLPSNCLYIPSDIVDRGQGTIVCDLNAQKLPVFPKVDVVVFSGVLEYIYDVPRLFAFLGNNCEFVIASYAVVADNRPLYKAQRRKQGWINDYSTKEFIKFFLECDFDCLEETMWRKQKLFKFRKRHST